MNGDSISAGAHLARSSDAGTAAPAEAVFVTVRPVIRAMARWMERRRQRKQLSQLDDHLLRDIGITPVEARREASRWFFQ
ncbi:DUF1127 domain-containing protein [Hoeflea sp.]|uniref:DUF1127 domain-containing protein n=1 Tax=Hoeflea sp. TaxID=1940281 RepID=UPI0025C017E8|nr:DUF1127 domain-containing protein [Hoeflea sp.]